MQILVIAHTGVALTNVLTASKTRLASFGFWTFSYIWFGLAPLAALITGIYPWSYRASEWTSCAAVAVIEVGLLAYSLGQVLAAPKRRASRAGAPTPLVRGLLDRLLTRRLVPSRVVLMCALTLVVGFAFIVDQVGGISIFFRSRQAVQSGTIGQVLRSWLLSVAAFWALLGLARMPRQSRRKRLLWRCRRLLLPLVVALNVIVNNPISQPRFWVGTVMLSLLFSVRKMCRPRVFRITAAALLAAVLFAFPYCDYFRYDDRERVTVLLLTEQFTTNGDYDAFQQVQTGLDYAREHGYAPENVFGALLFMVPRSVWPNKPQDTGIALAHYAGYRFVNLSAPLWIESYLWAGLPAVLITFCLLGMLGRRVDDTRNRLHDSGDTLAVLLVPAFAFYQMIFLRGSLLGIIGPLMLLVAIPLLITAPGERISRSKVAASIGNAFVQP
ncbi:hypothetical protein ACGFX8_36460 [Streptomyces sp. NPDC048362]|uniref:hypothetical protein n=1 Tax=Streptomyces sp. NPDC048362 TaxID=3365539 RepID=UPI0037140E29